MYYLPFYYKLHDEVKSTQVSFEHYLNALLRFVYVQKQF